MSLKVTVAKTSIDLSSRPAAFTLTLLGLRAGGFAFFTRAEVVLVAVAAAVDEGQALLHEAVVGPACLPELTGALHGWQRAHAQPLVLT